MFPHRQTSLLPCLLLLALWALGGSGCALLFDEPVKHTAHSPLQPIVAPRDVIELEIYFIDRRVGDPTIGEGLWGSLFAVTAVAPDVREQLATDGFRFAMAPTRPPRPLQSLMKLSPEQDPNPSQRSTRQVYSVLSGQEAQVLVSQLPDGTPLVRPRGDGVQTVELNSAQCLLRVQARRVDDGWAELSIIPEIQHGANIPRPLATDREWVYRQGQVSLPFYQDRLSAQLNVGELVVLGLNANAPNGLASHYFRSDIGEGIERLVLIRIANIREVKPVRSAEKF